MKDAADFEFTLETVSLEYLKINSPNKEQDENFLFFLILFK